MGHRCNELIIRDGRLEIRREHWGAFSLPSTLLLGPEIALAPKPTDIDENDDEPYSEGYAEGGFLADVDQRLLLFYSDITLIDESLGLRRAFLPLLEARWPGWRVRYATRGLRELLDHAGVRPDGLISERKEVTPATRDALFKSRQAVAHILRHPFSHEEYAKQISPWFFFRGYEETIVTVRDHDGQLHDHPFGIGLERVLAKGTGLLAVLAELPPVTPPNEQCAGAGVLFDVPARRIFAWWARCGTIDLPALARHWPGWRMLELAGGLPAQLEMSGRDGDSVRLPRHILVAEAYQMLAVDPHNEQDCRRLLERPREWSLPYQPEATAALRHLALTGNC